MEKAYTSKDVAVFYDAKLCIHAAECVRGLPAVFNTSKKPWIDPSQAAAETITEVIHKCPSGALRYERTDGIAEKADFPNMSLTENGPIHMRGAIQLEDEQGNLLFKGTRVALCRCGKSKNKPFCDRSHLSGFEAGLISGKFS